jgi:hypothetical protein
MHLEQIVAAAEQLGIDLVVRLMFSCARIGLPAATLPINGNRFPPVIRPLTEYRGGPGNNSSTPRAIARKCSSAALADLNLNAVAISARVGGIPDSPMES